MLRFYNESNSFINLSSHIANIPFRYNKERNDDVPSRRRNRKRSKKRVQIINLKKCLQFSFSSSFIDKFIHSLKFCVVRNY